MAKQELLDILNFLKVVFVKFSDEQASSNSMKLTYLGRQSLEFLLKNVTLRLQK